MPVVFKEHFEFTDSHIEQEEHGDEFCPDVEFLVLFEGEVTGFSFVKTKGSGPFPYFADRFQDTSVYTNLDNGKSLTFMSQGRAADRKIVDNDDGTITISFQFTGRTFVYGPDGARLFVDTGQVRSEFLIDYNGTPANTDDDIFLGETVLRDTGRNDTEGRDFCEDLVTFLG